MFSRSNSWVRVGIIPQEIMPARSRKPLPLLSNGLKYGPGPTRPKKERPVPPAAKMTSPGYCKDAPPFGPGKYSRKVKRNRIKFAPSKNEHGFMAK